MNEALIRWLMVPAGRQPFPDLSDVLRRPEWQRYAACRGQGTEGFIIGRGGDYEPSRQLCAGCPVRQECLEFALTDVDLIGMWGGTSERERKGIRAGRGVA